MTLDKENLLLTKLNFPDIGIDTVWRNRLIQQVNENEHRLTVISAPTGYGKTVLLSQIISLKKNPVVWYQLDSFDNDFSLFIRYLILGISQKIIHFGLQTLKFIANNEDLYKQMRTVIVLLNNELQVRAQEGITIILDDYHLIQNKQIHQFVEEMIQYLPKGIHIMISSRYELPFNIVRLKSHGMVNEIKCNQLKFNKDEIKVLFDFQKDSSIADKIIEKFEFETDGWIVALSLIKIASKKGNNKKDLVIQCKNREDIYHYFAEEVFHQLTTDLQTFLINTSVLDVLTPDVCNILTERKDSEEVLQTILKQNIFLTKLESEQLSYRYHHLFQDFLTERLEDKNKLLEKVGNYYSEKGYYEQAVENYILAKNFEKASLKIEQIGINLIKSGKWQTINRWVQKIPAKYTERIPNYKLFKGVIYNQKGMWDEALIQIEEALKIIRVQGSEKDFVDACFQKAIVLRRAGHLKDSLYELTEILTCVNSFPIIEWYDIALEKVNTLLWCGDLNEAVKTLKIGIEFARRDGEHRLIAYFMENLGATYYAMGEYYKAIKYYNLSKEEILPEYNSFSEFEKERYSQRTTLSVIYRDWGELDKALDLIKEEIDTKERLGLIDDLPRAYNQLALICNDKGHKEQSEKYFKHSDELYDKLDRRDFQWTWHLALYGKILIDNGKKEKGKELIKKAIKCAEKNSEFNLSLCEFIGCYAYINEGEIPKAIKALEHDLEVAKKVGSKNLICQCCWVLSNIYAAIGHKDKSKEYATECFVLASEGNYLQIFLSYEQTSFPIIKLGLEMGIEEEFIEKIVLRLGNKTETMIRELIDNSDTIIKQRGENLLKKVKSEGTNLSNKEESLVLKSESVDKNQLIRINVLGTFEVYGKDERVPAQWKTKKAMELFAYFINNVNQTINKDKLLEDIWPEMDPEQTTKWLHTYVYQIRSVLKSYGIKNGLIYKNHSYCLKIEEIDCDVDQFELLIHSCAEDTTERYIQKLEKIISLYKGEYLTGFYNNWILEERNRLEGLFLVTLEKISQKYMEIQDYKSAIDYWNRMLEVDRLLEHAHKNLMFCYEKMDDRISWIKQYQRYFDILKTELSIEPKKEMKDLYKKMLISK